MCVRSLYFFTMMLPDVDVDVDGVVADESMMKQICPITQKYKL